MKSKKTKYKNVFFVLLSFAFYPSIIRASDYTQEIEKINTKLKEVESSIPNKSNDDEKRQLLRLRQIKLRTQLSTLTGSTQGFADVLKKINTLIEENKQSPSPFIDSSLLLIKANLLAKIHRFKEAEKEIVVLKKIQEGTTLENEALEVLQTDIDLNLGRYKTAQKKLLALVKKDRSWENLSRLANFYFLTGNSKKADQLYAEAENQLTTRQMRDFAWIQLQRAILQLESEKFKKAKEFLEKAQKAYSGHWLIEEHLAEVNAELGNTDEAIKLYKTVIQKNDGAEYPLALSSLLEKRDPQQSLFYKDKALKLFQEHYNILPEAIAGHWIEHALENEIDSLHHLQSYAEENLALRPNSESKFLLAKIYFKNGNKKLAKKYLLEVEKSPWRKPSYLHFKKENPRFFENIKQI